MIRVVVSTREEEALVIAALGAAGLRDLDDYVITGAPPDRPSRPQFTDLASLKAAGMYRDDGGPSYVERHRHMPDEPCGSMCRGNPAKLGGNGGWTGWGSGSSKEGGTGG